MEQQKQQKGGKGEEINGNPGWGKSTILYGNQKGNLNEDLVSTCLFIIFEQGPVLGGRTPPPLPKTTLFHCTPPLLGGFSNQIRGKNWRSSPLLPPVIVPCSFSCLIRLLNSNLNNITWKPTTIIQICTKNILTRLQKSLKNPNPKNLMKNPDFWANYNNYSGNPGPRYYLTNH